MGKFMSRFYPAFGTMKQLTSINGRESMVDILGLICKSRELLETVLRMNERKTLNSLKLLTGVGRGTPSGSNWRGRSRQRI